VSEQPNGICAAGSCQWCGCTFRRPSDVMYHRCAAMQEGAEPPEMPPSVFEPEWLKQAGRADAPPSDERGYRMPTWRDAIEQSQRQITHAYDRRKGIFQQAYRAGLTMRQIGEAAGMSAAGVQKIIGRQRGGSLEDRCS
jgi:hypothetical protein